MPRHIKIVETVNITASSVNEFYKKINYETERMIRKGLEVSMDGTLNSIGYYNASVCGYKIVKEW